MIDATFDQQLLVRNYWSTIEETHDVGVTVNAEMCYTALLSS